LAEQPFNMFPSRPDSDEYGRYTEYSNAGFGIPPTTGPLDMTMGAFPRSGHDMYTIPTTAGFEQSLFAETSHFMLHGQPSPAMYAEECDMRLPSSSLSTGSATSSAIGSPLSNHGQSNAAPEWGVHGLGVRPGIVPNDYMPGSEYSGYSSHGLDEMNFDLTQPKGFISKFQLFSCHVLCACLGFRSTRASLSFPARSWGLPVADQWMSDCARKALILFCVLFLFGKPGSRTGFHFWCSC
jgi:hypothetical protein